MKIRKTPGLFQKIFNVWPNSVNITVRLLLLFVFVASLFTTTEITPARALDTTDQGPRRPQTDISTENQELRRLRKEVSTLDQRVQSLMRAEAKLATELASRDAQLKWAIDSMVGYIGEVAEKDEQLYTQGKELEHVLVEIKQKTGLLQEREKRLSDLILKLTQAEQDLAKAKSELSGKEKSLSNLRASLDGLRNRVASLSDKMAGHVNEEGRLNRLLVKFKESEATEKTKAAALQKEISALKSKLTETSGKQGSMEGDAGTKSHLSQSVDLMDLPRQKDQEIDKLIKFARYRAAFLSKLQERFADVPNIKVQGDRVVFQSEIMFASGKADMNESGKRELDKFASIYREVISEIPDGNDIMILVQGHTDVNPVKSGKYRSNWDLSADRAIQVVNYLITKKIPPERLGATALAEFHPVADGNSPEANRLNRRIEIKITAP
jgi:chemotaxis protein MotB